MRYAAEARVGLLTLGILLSDLRDGGHVALGAAMLVSGLVHVVREVYSHGVFDARPFPHCEWRSSLGLGGRT